MSTRGELMAAGMPAAQAIQIGTSGPLTGLVALGTTKATALAMTGSVNVFATASAGASGASLPAAAGGPPVFVYNGGSGNLLVYTGNTTDVINAGSAGAAFTVTNGKSCAFWPAANTWIANLSA